MAVMVLRSDRTHRAWKVVGNRLAAGKPRNTGITLKTVVGRRLVPGVPGRTITVDLGPARKSSEMTIHGCQAHKKCVRVPTMRIIVVVGTISEVISGAVSPAGTKMAS